MKRTDLNEIVSEYKEEILGLIESDELADALVERGWLVFYNDDEVLDYVLENYTLLERIKARL